MTSVPRHVHECVSPHIDDCYKRGYCKCECGESWAIGQRSGSPVEHTPLPAPSVPTSPPAGPAVSPEIDALIEKMLFAHEEVVASSKGCDVRPGGGKRFAAARAALREAFRTREAEVARLTKERERMHGIINGCPRCQTENAFQYTTSKLRHRGSAHKEKE